MVWRRFENPLLRLRVGFALAAAVSASGCGVQINSLAELLQADVEDAYVATATSWALSNGATSIELRAAPTRDSTIYYAVFDADQGALTAAQVQAAALACAGACKAGGSFAATTGGTTESISALADKVLYSVYAVHEDDEGLAADSAVKHYAGVLPKRNSMQSFATALANGVGVGATVRYSVYYPPGYYDNPTTNYPVMMYVHGGGETSNNAANTDADFALMSRTPFTAAIASGDDYPAIFVQPQCNDALWNCANTQSTNYLAEVVDVVNATYRTNPKKFSVIGMSWGGAGALHFAYDYPSKISAVVGVAGGLYSRSGSAANLCAKFATNKVALWAINNTQDPYYNSAAVTGGGGIYPSTMVSTITTNCTGYPDARFTEYNDNTTFPANYHGHLILEFSLGNSAYYDYANCTGGNGFKSYNGTTCAADTNPPTYRIPLHPAMLTALQTASTALTGSSTSFGSLTDWMLHFTKP